MKESRNSIENIWGERTPYKGEWPARVDEYYIEQPDKWVQSACVLCSNGCGMDIGVKNGKIVGVRGREMDRVNRGRLGPKGLHGWMANESKDRLTTPLVRQNGELRPTTWDAAMNLIVNKSKEIIEKYTSNAIGIYNSGQLFLEEYYTLAVIARAGLGTPHIDGNTRLCTSTSSWALKLSFGTDGQPASYTDIDVTDALFLVGHNMASTQTVLWSRVLDRLHSANKPKLIVVDPRATYTSEYADVHLMPKVGTNVPVLNGILNYVITKGQIDTDFIARCTIGFDELERTVSKWKPELVEKVTGIPQKDFIEAAEIIANAPTLLSTALQGVFQSMQATAAAVQINNLQLIRGMIGKPGCGVFQMNGQPTAQNTRECGANGEMPAFRNWHNKEHMKELAAIWNVNPEVIPQWQPSTHIMQQFRYAEQGSLKMMWISCTNPAVSLPELSRIRKILQKEDFFVVVNDAFMTETAALADVVLPAAIWGEKTGCYTNADRTVHISHKAVDPPGDARSDFDIWLDYAERMGFHDKDGLPLIKWKTPEEAFEAWKVCSKGRPCDYSGLSYKKLTGNSGIQWPCNEQYPEGKAQLYTDGVFNTDFNYCEGYTHDLVTGAEMPPFEYKALNPAGKAILLPCDYEPPHEQPDEKYPLWLTTGRVVYHFHTRTKTGRALPLQNAAPDMYIQISEADAKAYNIADGELIKVESRSGRVEGPARIGGIAPGLIFIPFHYGYWDGEERFRAANELTKTSWDAVSKQPHFKYAAVRIEKTDTGAKKALSDTKDSVVDVMKGVFENVKQKLKI
jgi:anaerobic selenocysteine-containing dehydrogenase